MSNQDDIAIVLNTDVVDCKELIQLLSSSSNRRKQILDIPLSQWQRWTDAIEHKAPAGDGASLAEALAEDGASLAKALAWRKAAGMKDWEFPVFDKVFANVNNETEEIEKKRRAANVFYANCLYNHLFKKYTGYTMKKKWYDAIRKQQQGDFENFAYFTDVTRIGNGAFSDNEMTSVIIPNGVKEIEDFAFDRNKLTSVIIPNKVTHIGHGAFWNNELTSVIIGNGVKEIGDGAFHSNELTSVNIPNGVTRIGEHAFSYNKLTSVNIPNGLKKIGRQAFSHNRLTSVKIPDSVEYIGGEAFDINELTSVSVGESTKIEDNTFDENVKIIRRFSKKRSASSSGGAGSSSKRQRMKLIGMQLEAALKF